VNRVFILFTNGCFVWMMLFVLVLFSVNPKKERKCGGVADRLKSVPFYIAAAASSDGMNLFDTMGTTDNIRKISSTE